MDEMLKAFEPQIEEITLIPSDGGRFEITVNDQLIYSKLQTNRHIDSGEATNLLRTFMEQSS
jgi:selenoprotein W-related protein